MFKVTLALLLIPFCVPAQDISAMQTATMMNGRGWNTMGRADKVIYVTALHDAVAISVVAGAPVQEQAIWKLGFNIGEYVKELDKVYSATENVRIPIPMAMVYCAARLQGQMTAKELELQLINLRKRVAEVK